MSSLEPGCLARVIKSLSGQSTGKIVQCIKIVGTHPEYGTIWHIHSKDTLYTEFGAGNYGDHPAIWLKKIEPGELDKIDSTKKEDELIKEK